MELKLDGPSSCRKKRCNTGTVRLGWKMVNTGDTPPIYMGWKILGHSNIHGMENGKYWGTLLQYTWVVPNNTNNTRIVGYNTIHLSIGVVVVWSSNTGVVRCCIHDPGRGLKRQAAERLKVRVHDVAHEELGPP